MKYIIVGNTKKGFSLVNTSVPGMVVVETFSRKWQAEDLKEKLLKEEKK